MNVKLPYEYETEVFFIDSKVHITQKCDTHGDMVVVLTLHQFEVIVENGKQFFRDLNAR